MDPCQADKAYNMIKAEAHIGSIDTYIHHGSIGDPALLKMVHTAMWMYVGSDISSYWICPVIECGARIHKIAMIEGIHG